MSPWLIAAAVVLTATVAPLYVCARQSLAKALVALELSGVLATVVLLLLAEGFHRGALFDPALVLALLTFIGSLAFVRMMERRV
jgi:multisubunit Na+/H+ antiporter MnhF subunit